MREAGGPPGTSDARDPAAEQLRVVVADAEHALVERLLRGPDRGGRGTGEGAAEGPGRATCPAHCNDALRAGYRRAVTDEPAHAALHARAREKGVNPLVYWLVRAVLQPVFHLYFRLSRIGREHIPESGPVILCSNHRSFLDPFVIGTCLRRPVYYVAKEELFKYRFVAWILNSLGAFPVVRGTGDQDMLATAKAILARGDAVLMFAEGTRIRPGALGRPKRGVGRLALETGAPVVPVAVIGTEAVRNGWRFRPHKVRIRIGGPLTFPKVEQASRAARRRRHRPHLAQRDAPVGVARRPAAAAPRRRHRRRAPTAPRSPRCSPAPACRSTAAPPATSPPTTSSPSPCPAEQLPAALERHGAAIPERAGVLVLSREMVPPEHVRPSEYVAARTAAWAVGVVRDAQAALDGAGPLVLAAADTAFRRQVGDALTSAGVAVTATRDVAAVGDRHRRAGAPRRDRAPRQGRTPRRFPWCMASSEHTREEKARLDDAFSALYKAHLRDVYSYSYYRVGNHHDAEDLTEQTFLQAYRHFERAQKESDGPAAAAVADPHRPQPGRELLPRPVAQAADADRRRGRARRRRTRRRISSRIATTWRGSSPVCSSCRTTAARR